MPGTVPTAQDVMDMLTGLGYPTSTAGQTAILAAVNMGCQRVVTTRRWKFLESSETFPLTAGGYIASLSSVGRNLLRVKLTDSTGADLPITYADPEEFRELEQQYTGDASVGMRGTPRYYTVRNEAEIVFTPRADASYTVTMDTVVEQAKLTSGGQNLIIPWRYIDSVLWAALSYMSIRDRDNATFQMAESNFNLAMRRMLATENLRTNQNADQVQRSEVWDDMGNIVWLS